MADTPLNDAPKLNDSKSASFSTRLRLRLGKLGAIIASVAAVGAVVGGLAGYWHAWDILHSHVGRDTTTTTTAASTGLIVSKGPSVAVLPVSSPIAAPGLGSFADRVTQQLASSLGRFSTLRVIPRATAANFLKEGDDAIKAARKAQVDYLVSGEVHPLGGGARANIHVSDLRTGTEIWSQSFDANAEGVQTETSAYEIGDAAAVQIGGYPGAIMNADYSQSQNKPVFELSPYECIVHAVVGSVRGLSSAILKALECSKRLTERQPNNAFAWSARATVLFNQRSMGIGLPSDQIQHTEKRLYLNEEILRGATRAVELAPDDAFAQRTYALAMSTKCQIHLYRQELEKALALNPNDARTLSGGMWLAFMGDWDDGSAMAERAIRLAGPNASFAWWLAPAKRHWWKGEYQQALEDFRHAYLEGFWLSHLDQAYALPFLGRFDEAKAEVGKLLKLRPDFTIREADSYYRMFCFQPEYIEKMNSALRQAGLPE
ncbi:TolB-like protein [Bradyrhizobium japonicum]